MKVDMQQMRDMRTLQKYTGLCRRAEWLVSPSLRFLQSVLIPHHRIIDRENYFQESMKLIGAPTQRSFSHYTQELLNDVPLRNSYEKACAAGKTHRKYASYEDRILRNQGNVVNFYALVRECQPRIIVETGTASGSMTSWMLTALARNGAGKLISIDLPPTDGQLTMDMTIDEADIGFLIPQDYRNRWNYIAGDAKLFLPKILSENKVDIFIHDSLHTRTHMLFEYHVARALLPEGALILSDDILWNKSFFSFIASHNLRSLSCISNPNVGLTVNRFEAYEREIGIGIVRRETLTN